MTLESEEARFERDLECERAKILCRDDGYDCETPFDAASSNGPRIWMEGVPEWAASDLGVDGHGWDDTHIYRTAWVCELFGEQETPAGWTRVIAYNHSGETECLCGEVAMGFLHGDADPKCKLCDGDGLIYVGDGYREVIYRAPKGLFWPDENCARCGHDLCSFDKHEGTFDEHGNDYVLCMNEACMRDRLISVVECFTHKPVNPGFLDMLMRWMTPRKTEG